MKLLLDECTPRRLRGHFPGHEVLTVDDAGLKGLKNGELLRAAAGKFDVLLTVDRNIPFQQNLTQVDVALIILIAGSNRFEALKPLVPAVLAALQTIRPGQLVQIVR
jgi:predicted nuclease of predicted toxin-antitoxin system